jgi:acrosin
MSQYHLQWGGLASLVYVILTAIAPAAAQADMPLTRADVDQFQNQVEILLRGGPTRPVRPSDWLSRGDAIRTERASQVDLRFNDGSLARIGELATFWFVPNTRNFRLSNGTALLLVPPGRGASVIETPNVVTGIQGTAVLVRHFPADPEAMAPPADLYTDFEHDAGRTAVMVLTNSGPVQVRLRDGREVPLSAGQMAIVDNGNLYLFEFDLALFYETSPLVEGLLLDAPDAPGAGLPTDEVRQEIWEGLSAQQEFVGDYLLNPTFLSPGRNTDPEQGWLFPANAQSTPPTNTPPSTSSPAATPTSPPHENFADDVDLVPPAIDSRPDDDLPRPDSEVDEAPGRIPPGLIDPSPSNNPLPPSGAPEPPTDLPSTPELSPPVPEFDDVPGGDDGPGEG